MMDQEKWAKLEETFNDETQEWESGCIDYTTLDFDIMGWLDCSTRGPSWEMMAEFEKNGYKVVCHERDSFGWLIGGVRQKSTGKEIIFG